MTPPSLLARALLVLRSEWRRHRLTLSLGLVVTGFAALLLGYRVAPGVPPIQPRTHQVAFASSEVLIDSAVSQVTYLSDEAEAEYGSAVDLQGLVTRAHLLASLMSTSPFDDQIASAAALEPHRLTVVAPTGFGPPTSPSSAPDVAPGDSLLNIAVNETLPLIRLNAQAPDAATARRLVDAATSHLRDYVNEAAVAHRVSPSQRLRVSPIGKVTSVTIDAGPRKVVIVAAFLVLLAVWTLTVTMRPHVVRYWRHVAGVQTGA